MNKEFTLFLSTCKCGHRYLGSSSRKNVGKSYFGSGSKWSKHKLTCEVVDYEELHRTHNHDLHCQKAEEFSDFYDVVESENFYNVQTEKGVPLNNGHIGVGSWSKELQKLWNSKDKDKSPDYKDALNWTGEGKWGPHRVTTIEEPDIVETVMNEDLVEHFLDMLTPREAFIIKCRFGIGCKPLTFEQIAKKVINLDTGKRGIAKEGVRIQESRALRKLRTRMVIHDL